MVPLGVLVFVSETESAAPAGGLLQVVVEKAEKRNRRRSLSRRFLLTSLERLFRSGIRSSPLRTVSNRLSERASVPSEYVANCHVFRVYAKKASAQQLT
jgi:hypothetical protein